ncbi:hypothetical protein A33M_2686 [Rhodovulum sp. PH10]|nr:hypothetical protein A33M_2686 [Rhodovulum sp. PH10]
MRAPARASSPRPVFPRYDREFHATRVAFRAILTGVADGDRA